MNPLERSRPRRPTSAPVRWGLPLVTLLVGAAGLVAQPGPWAGDTFSLLPDTLSETHRPVRPLIVGAALGSASGLLVGYGVGVAADAVIDDCDAEEPYGEDSFCAVVPAVVLGSIIGSALGARIAAGRIGGQPSRARALGAATLGLLTGALGSALVSSLDDSGLARFVGFSLGQGILTGVMTANRHRPPARGSGR